MADDRQAAPERETAHLVLTQMYFDEARGALRVQIELRLRRAFRSIPEASPCVQAEQREARDHAVAEVVVRPKAPSGDVLMWNMNVSRA